MNKPKVKVISLQQARENAIHSAQALATAKRIWRELGMTPNEMAIAVRDIQRKREQLLRGEL